MPMSLVFANTEVSLDDSPKLVFSPNVNKACSMRNTSV